MLEGSLYESQEGRNRAAATYPAFILRQSPAHPEAAPGLIAPQSNMKK